MKSKLNKFFKAPIILISLIIIYLVVLFLTSLIPRETIMQKTSETADILVKETMGPVVDLGYKKIYLDNSTTALMINNAYSIDNNNPLYSSLIVRKNYIPNVTEIENADTQEELRVASKKGGQVSDLKNNVLGKNQESFEYARYWHGYLIILRVLLIFLNINQIRILSITMISILCVILLYSIHEKVDRKSAILMLVGLSITEFFVLGIELQGQINLYIALISSIIILVAYDKKIIKNYCLYFLIIGSITNFFDFLTMPIITYGIPLIVYFKLRTKMEEISIKEMLKKIMIFGIAWTLGYAITWFSKWLIVDLLYNKGVVASAINQVIYRGYNTSISFIGTVLENLKLAQLVYKMIFVYILVINIAYFVYDKIMKRKLNKNVILYAVISCIPLVWYFVVRKHSYQHAFFTYRIMMVTIMAQLMLLGENLERYKKNKKIEE